MATQFAQDTQQYTKAVEVPAKYQRHAKVFNKEASNQFPPSQSWDHAIKLKKDAPRAIDCKIYPMTPTEDEALLKFLKEMQERGTSNHQSPCMHHHSSLFERKMANSNQCKTTGNLMNGLSQTNPLTPNTRSDCTSKGCRNILKV
jgi:hypothetical protein